MLSRVLAAVLVGAWVLAPAAPAAPSAAVDARASMISPALTLKRRVERRCCQRLAS